MVVFNSSLNQFARKYLVKNPGENRLELAKFFQIHHDESIGELLEQLLLFEKVSIKVYGENLPLIMLIGVFGIDAVFELLEQKAIEFVQWTPTLGTFEDDSLIGKVMPIVSGSHTSAVHSIPEESVKAAISSLSDQPSRNIRRDLISKVSKAYRVPEGVIVQNAAELVMSAYSSDKLTSFGMKKDTDISYLDRTQRLKLVGLGESVLETAILAEYNYSSYGNYSYYAISQESMRAIKNATSILSSTSEIFRSEQIPNIRELIKEHNISAKDILRLRRRGSSEKFRNWIQDNGKDRELVLKAYIDDIANHKGFFDTTHGKFVKIMSMYAVGSALGGVVGGVPGAIAGGPVVSAISEIGLSTFDSFFLERILKGWTPRIFINEYQHLVNHKASK